MKLLEDLLSFQLRNSGGIVHFTQDEHGKILVIDDGEYRILNFDSPFEQSCMNMSVPYQLVHQYTQYMSLIFGFVTAPQKVGLLGLGGGSLLRTAHHLFPHCHFDVVELRQKVVDIAGEYFLIPEDHRVKITVDNAIDAINHWQPSTVDVLFSDMYSAYQMVGEQVQLDFLNQCSKVLTNKGWLVLNLHSLPEKRADFLEMLNGIFPTLYITTNTANTIIFACNCPSDLSRFNNTAIKNIGKELGQNFKKLTSRIAKVNGSHVF